MNFKQNLDGEGNRHLEAPTWARVKSVRGKSRKPAFLNQYEECRMD